MSKATLARNGRNFTADERAEYKQQKRAEQREQVENATRALLSSDGWRRWAETRATFRLLCGGCWSYLSSLGCLSL
jgi:hypothetical protein